VAKVFIVRLLPVHLCAYIRALLIALGLLAGDAQAGSNQWTRYGPAGGALTAFVIDPSTPSTPYAGGSDVYKSTDGGEHWTAMNTGLTTTHVTALALDPQKPTTLYAGTDVEGILVIEQEAPLLQ